MKSGNVSIYKKCGILVLSFPGLDRIDCCINSIKNNPKALCALSPKSPLLVQTRVISPLSKALSKSKLFVLLHKILFTPGYLNKLSNSAEAVNTEVLVLFKSVLLA